MISNLDMATLCLGLLDPLRHGGTCVLRLLG